MQEFEILKNVITIERVIISYAGLNRWEQNIYVMRNFTDEK